MRKTIIFKRKDKNIDAVHLAILLHEKYEELSRKHNWKTQKKCRTKFHELPAENQKVMYGMGEYVLRLIKKSQPPSPRNI